MQVSLYDPHDDEWWELDNEMIEFIQYTSDRGEFLREEIPAVRITFTDHDTLEQVQHMCAIFDNQERIVNGPKAMLRKLQGRHRGARIRRINNG